MYERFFALQQHPFSLLPDPDFLFLGDQHRAALDRAELAVLNQCGFCVISGEVGVGKTTLLRELLRRLDQRLRVGLVSNTHAAFGGLMQWVAAAFGLQDGGADRLELQQRFVDFVIRRYAQNQRTLLIIDEAQNLSVGALEELRMLSNLNSDKHLVLQVILAGQPALRESLRRPELRQFAQRVAVEYHLSALDVSETRQYIAHRLAHAGGAANLFEPDTCLLIQDASGGIPRLINRICDLSLVYAYAQQRPVVDPEIVATVLRDQELGGMFESLRQALPISGDTGLAVTEHAAPRATIASAGTPPPVWPGELPEPPQYRAKAGGVQVGDAVSRMICGELPVRPAVVDVALGAAPAPPAKDLSKAGAAPTGAVDRAELSGALTGSRDQSVAATAHPVPGLYRLVVDTQVRRTRSGSRGTTLVLSLAVAVTAAAAGSLIRDRSPELVSGIVNNLPGAAEVVSGAKAVLMSRSLAGVEPAMPLAGRPTALDPGAESLAAISLPGDDAQVPPSAVAEPQAVASVAQHAGLAGLATSRDDVALQREMERIDELKRQAGRLARERRAAAQQLAAERRARERFERSARAERERIRTAERGLADVAAERGWEFNRSMRDDTAQPAAHPGAPQPTLQRTPAQTAKFADSAQDGSATAANHGGTFYRQPAAAAAKRRDDRFVPNPCDGPTARFMTTCF